MISHLTGTILDLNPRSITLDVQGVGYQVHLPLRELEKLQTGAALSLHIHTALRENDISLYGFPTKEALQFFEQLISVNRVGPKSAISIMETPIQQTLQAIAKKDIAFLSRIPGIGKKTAERIILELHEKIAPLVTSENGVTREDPSNISSDMLDALMRMGYQRKHVMSVLKDLPKELTDEKAVITYFLQHV